MESGRGRTPANPPAQLPRWKRAPVPGGDPVSIPPLTFWLAGSFGGPIGLKADPEPGLFPATEY